MANIIVSTEIAEHIAKLDKQILEKFEDSSVLEWMDSVLECVLLDRQDNDGLADLLGWARSAGGSTLFIIDYDDLLFTFSSHQNIKLSAQNQIMDKLTKAAKDYTEREKDRIYMDAAKMCRELLLERKRAMLEMEATLSPKYQNMLDALNLLFKEKDDG